MSISDPQISLNSLGCVEKMTEMISKGWNIDTNFVVSKKHTNIRINLKTYVYSSFDSSILQTLLAICF